MNPPPPSAACPIVAVSLPGVAVGAAAIAFVGAVFRVNRPLLAGLVEWALDWWRFRAWLEQHRLEANR